ncbi:MAG: hypothetical protein ACKVQJ_11270 [Pyrinomonadaceae bacterium]
MSDESESNEKPVNGEWAMPEPIFRTTDGRTPSSLHETVPADETPTAPGFRDAITVETEGLPPASAEERDNGTAPISAEPVKVKAAPAKSKRGGCAKTFLVILSLIGIVAIALIIAVVYFLVYFRPAETGTF